jgi:hypothetical protein
MQRKLQKYQPLSKTKQETVINKEKTKLGLTATASGEERLTATAFVINLSTVRALPLELPRFRFKLPSDLTTKKLLAFLSKIKQHSKPVS